MFFEPMSRANEVLLYLVIIGTFGVPVAYAIYRRRRPAPELAVRTACLLQGLGCGMCALGLPLLIMALFSPRLAFAATILPLGLYVALWLGDPGTAHEGSAGDTASEAGSDE